MPADFSTRGGGFPATRQSAVRAVGSDDAAERARAFEVLVRAYFKPVYKHVRLKWRRPAEDAQDLTQGFFARAFEKRFFGTYDPERARFRTYLKTCLDRYVAETARDERRLKRGGGAIRLNLDFETAEGELAQAGPGTAESIEACFDAEWTKGLMSSALDELRDTCAAKKKEAYFAVLERYVLEGEERKASYADVARELGLSVSDVTNYLSWSRRELRRILLDKLREITSNEEEFQSEARALFGDGG